MLLNRLFSALPIFFIVFLSFKFDLLCKLIFIYILPFFIYWEFIRLFNFRKNIKKDNSQTKNNFFLTRLKISALDYACIFSVQCLFSLYFYFDDIIYFLPFLVFFTLSNISVEKFIGFIYLTLPILIFVYFFKTNQFYQNFILILVITICTDIGGYVCGKLFKGPKLFPKISPNKTWAGFFGGIIFSIICCTLYYSNSTFSVNFFLVVIFLSLCCQIGDFIESFYKRLCKVKESSNLIPGHGGVLDRFDGAFFLIVMIYILNKINSTFLSIFVV